VSEPISIPVSLDPRAYDVVVGGGLLAEAGGRIATLAPGARVAIVTDRNVARLHLAALEASLDAAGVGHVSFILPPGEGQKSFTGLEQLSTSLLASGLERRDLVIAFGGGVIGDLAGFAAGIVKRGLDFVQIPTTLLAQVDSSVGGKTAIDTPVGKNLIGLFHQPRLVLADLDVLKTLPERELRAGYAEIVKYGLIDDPDFFSWCERHSRDVLAASPEALAHAVAHSVKAKARVVAADEREAGQRALLNLGHTFAHAFETEVGYDGALLHGEAVGTGMICAFAFSARLGFCPAADADRVRDHLVGAGFALPSSLPGAPYDVDRLLVHIAQDKKAEAGGLTFILARAIGAAFVHKRTPADAVRAFLSEAF
jgi:3-dehydroquinate synthase